MHISGTKTGGCCMNPLNPFSGASSIGCFYRKMPAVISINNYNYSGMFGYGYGNGCFDWSDYSYTYLHPLQSDVKEWKKYSIGDCIGSYFKRAFTTDFFGTAGTMAIVGAAGLGILGNLFNNLAGGNNNQQMIG